MEAGQQESEEEALEPGATGAGALMEDGLEARIRPASPLRVWQTVAAEGGGNSGRRHK